MEPPGGQPDGLSRHLIGNAGLPAGLTAAGLQNLIDMASRGSAFNRVQQRQPPVQPLFSEPAGLQPNPTHYFLSQLLSGLPAQAGMGILPVAGAQTAPIMEALPAPGRARPSRSADPAGTTNSYASRHQQAEARRRSRINERLDALRKIVPHTERANTAAFLEDVVNHVQRLHRRVAELEARLGLAPSVAAPAATFSFADAEGTAATGSGGTEALRALQRQQAGNGASTAVEASSKLPSVSEELAMAAQLAGGPNSAAAGVMAESQPRQGPSAEAAPFAADPAALFAAAVAALPGGGGAEALHEILRQAVAAVNAGPLSQQGGEPDAKRARVGGAAPN